MTGLELRPLTLQEVLDRTFTLYRRHFGLFIGITALPHLLTLAVGLASIFGVRNPARIGMDGEPNLGTGSPLDSIWWLSPLTVLVSLVVYLLTQGATIFAVSEIYLGRDTTIGGALRRVWGEFGTLFAVVVLNGLAIMGGTLLLVIPGIYAACRLLVCVPSALIEGKGPRESLGRSWELTKGYAGRSFAIYVLFIAVSFGLGLVAGLPALMIVGALRDNPEAVRMWQATSRVLSTAIDILISPLLLIATSVFYYDLRVRKEAFDLQFMLDPGSEGVTRRPGGLNSIT